MSATFDDLQKKAQEEDKKGADPRVRMPKAPVKRVRRNFQGEFIQLQSRVDMALKILAKADVQAAANAPFIALAIEILEGK